MNLEDYHKKRKFNKTPEPKGRIHHTKNNLFVVQKHAASHLHYDFRIESGGVLKSWAIPKGPCLDPTVKRLAIHVEDHPIEYGYFEGIIPKEEYGGGTVLLWDKGQWLALDENPEGAYDKGHLRFELEAAKLKGRWDLIRIDAEKNLWFLIKYKDKYAVNIQQYDVTQALPDSVLTKQSLAEISEGDKLIEEGDLDLPFSPMLTTIAPQLATLADDPPLGDEWLHEIKYDGYRILAFKKNKKIQLLSRNSKDYTAIFQRVADEINTLSIDNCILDGEMVYLDEQNRPNFELLQNAVKQKSKQKSFMYYIFDILYYQGRDIQSLPQITRKNLLKTLLLQSPPSLQYSDHVIGNGSEIYKRSCQMGLEGIISKRMNSRYENKRSKSWLKIKCTKRQTFVVGAYTLPKNSRNYFGALLLGIYDKNVGLNYCGKVGTGFNESALQDIYSRLKKIRNDSNPFQALAEMDQVVWVKPELLVDVAFTEWTKGGKLRHPSFKGLHQNKKAKEKVKQIVQPANDLLEQKPVTKNKAITNPGKILYPEAKITKGQLYDYYDQVSTLILPFLKNRLLTLLRCPDTYKKCFYQRHFNQSTAKSLILFSEQKKSEDYFYINDKEGLLSLVQMGVLEIHPWGSQVDTLEQPDMITIDLDPGPDLEWKKVVEAAFDVKNKLQQLQLTSFVKTTGGKGLHVVVPILPHYQWDIIKQFSELFVRFLTKENPDLYTANMSKAKRKGKIFLDYLRNQKGATAIAAYSSRARPHAPIATPLDWDELTSNIEDTFYTLSNFAERIDSLKTDPWKDFWYIKQELKMP